VALLPIIPTALTRKFGTAIGLSDQEREALEQLPAHSRHVKVGETLLLEGDRTQHCMVVLSGLACRFKMVGSEGHRQIMSFHIHGDIPDLQSLHLGVMDHDVGMLQEGKVSFIPHTAIRAMNERHPRIAAALWRDTLVDAAIFRAWMIGIGRKSAYGRLAHLLCERIVLAQGVGLLGHTIEQRPTQEELGDALGLSVVHVNRTMRALRENGLIVSDGKRLTVLDWEGLQEVGEFDPAYLQMEKMGSAGGLGAFSPHATAHSQRHKSALRPGCCATGVQSQRSPPVEPFL
jgi:CRP-like cAMP-binding protein